MLEFAYVMLSLAKCTLCRCFRRKRLVVTGDMKTFSAAANPTPELLLGAAPSERIHVNKDYYNGVLKTR